MGLYNNVICREDIDSLVFVLTGRRGVAFLMAFQVRMANELLRYTDLSMADVSKCAGFGSANTIYLTYKRFGIAPVSVARRFTRKGDVGRYDL